MRGFELAAWRATTSVLSCVGALCLVATACSSHNAPVQAQAQVPAPMAFQVGTTTADDQLPPEPQLPTDAQVCATVTASSKLVKRPDGALPPEADPSSIPTDPDPSNPVPWSQRGPPSLYGVDATDAPHWFNPDQARIQKALNDCGAAVDAQVGAAISGANAAAGSAGVSGEELTKATYKAAKFAVRLAVNSGGGDSFISGPLWLPSGVTLWIDSGAALFASRDVMAYNLAGATTTYCGNVAVSATSAGSSGNCNSMINGNNLVNSAVMGDGSIDGRAYAEIVTSDPLYPLIRATLTCTNTYAAYKTGAQAPDGTACDNGGTVVEVASNSRNMTWWDLAFLGNLIENGTTGNASQSNFRMMVFNNAKNLTLYRITLNNSANFHVVPSGVDGLTVWGVKLQTPSLAAFANPAGNGNPLYTGITFNKDNVKNTDAFDPGANSFSGGAPSATNNLTTGSTIATTTTPGGGSGYSETVLTTKGSGYSGATVTFDGYLKNVLFAYNYISTGDDDIALKGSKTPVASTAGIDGQRDVRSDRKWGVIIAHNHIYWGHGISVGSETNGGVANVHVYDNTLDGSEEGLRIKSDYSRGGVVSNVYYQDICIRNTQNALLFTTYYSTKALPASGPLYPNFHDLFLSNIGIIGGAAVKLEGFAANTGGFGEPASPLVMSMTNVVADSPDNISLIASDAKLTLDNVNLPILPSTDERIEVVGAAQRDASVTSAVDCSKAFVDFPSRTSPMGTSW
jgi:polygalacturonase